MSRACAGEIDLHIHTGSSDGAYGTAEEAVRTAAKLGLRAISLTEHDNIDTVHAGIEYARRYGVEYVTGVEITTHNSRRAFSYHVTAYMFDPDDESLRRFLERVRDAIQFNLRQTLASLKRAGFDVEWDFLEALAKRIYPDIPGRLPDWHVLSAALVEKGYADSLEKADEMRSKAFVNAEKIKAYPEQEAVFKHVKRAGGILFMAHPQGFIRDHFAPERLLRELVADGMDGIEAYSPKHDAELVEFYLELAQRVGCACSGGSDCHDVRRPVESALIGRCHVPYKVLVRMHRQRKLKFGSFKE